MAQLIKVGVFVGGALVLFPVAVGLMVLKAATGCDLVEQAKAER